MCSQVSRLFEPQVRAQRGVARGLMERLGALLLSLAAVLVGLGTGPALAGMPLMATWS